MEQLSFQKEQNNNNNNQDMVKPQPNRISVFTVNRDLNDVLHSPCSSEHLNDLDQQVIRTEQIELLIECDFNERQTEKYLHPSHGSNNLVHHSEHSSSFYSILCNESPRAPECLLHKTTPLQHSKIKLDSDGKLVTTFSVLHCLRNYSVEGSLNFKEEVLSYSDGHMRQNAVSTISPSTVKGITNDAGVSQTEAIIDKLHSSPLHTEANTDFHCTRKQGIEDFIIRNESAGSAFTSAVKPANNSRQKLSGIAHRKPSTSFVKPVIFSDKQSTGDPQHLSTLEKKINVKIEPVDLGRSGFGGISYSSEDETKGSKEMSYLQPEVDQEFSKSDTDRDSLEECSDNSSWRGSDGEEQKNLNEMKIKMSPLTMSAARTEKQKLLSTRTSCIKDINLVDRKVDHVSPKQNAEFPVKDESKSITFTPAPLDMKVFSKIISTRKLQEFNSNKNGDSVIKDDKNPCGETLSFENNEENFLMKDSTGGTEMYGFESTSVVSKHVKETRAYKEFDRYMSWNATHVCLVCKKFLNDLTEFKLHFKYSEKCKQYFADDTRERFYTCRPCKYSTQDFIDQFITHLLVKKHGDLGVASFPKDIPRSSSLSLQTSQSSQLTNDVQLVARCNKEGTQVSGRLTTGEKETGNDAVAASTKSKRKLKRKLQNHPKHFAVGYACKVCNRSYIRRSKAVEHLMHCVTKEFVYQCPICKIRLPSRRKRAQHMEIHNKKNFKCEFCPQTFVHHSNLVVHLYKYRSYDKHTKIKSVKHYACDICGRAFKSVEKRNEHTLTHGEEHLEKPSLFVCDTCGKTIEDETKFKTHVRIHETQKHRERKMCPICGKSYFESYFPTHKKTHEPKKLRCDLCGSMFRLKAHLDTHIMMRHENPRPFKCHVCNLAFNLKRYLRDHLKSKHSLTEYNDTTKSKTKV